MSTWGSKHVEESIILWINNNQCIKLVINIYSLEAVSIKNTAFWDMELCSLVESNKDFEEANC